MKKTDWFPNNTTPVRIGVYQTRLGNKDHEVWFQHWDGEEWGFSCMSAEAAACFARHRRIRSEFQKVQWRGLTKPA
jgi:hypothetical protein